MCLYWPVSKKVLKYNRQSETHIQDDRIGQIEILTIDVNLPIYKGTGEDVLEKGIGCLAEGSPLGGGENTHSILAGHRGLPGASLFFRLNELEKGDCFTLYVSGKELVYEVCNIHVIEPAETEILQIQVGKDLVSLVTCTPYGINTHRLVVTGERKVNNE